MYQSEALWLDFSSNRWLGDYPCAVKVATGKINAISGEPWGHGLIAVLQDYLVIPEQPWLDGYATIAPARAGHGCLCYGESQPLSASETPFS